jgi:hypothetical protein
MFFLRTVAIGTGVSIAFMVSAEAAGFKKSVYDNIELRVGDRLKLDVALEIG